LARIGGLVAIEMTESNIAAINRIHAQLIERWPDVFNVKKPVPLAIGIHAALLEAIPDITDQQLRRVLARWCTRPHYLKTLIAGADRHGLEGILGTVSEDAAKLAAEQMEALDIQFREKAKAKREAEKAEKARQAEAERKKAEKEAQEAKKAATAPPPPKPTPATPKPTGVPVIVVKKRRAPPPEVM
jgi:sRNA-binding protein